MAAFFMFNSPGSQTTVSWESWCPWGTRNPDTDELASQFSKPVLTGGKVEQIHWPVSPSIYHSWLLSSFYLNSRMTIIPCYSCLSVPHCLFCFLVPPRHILPIHYILLPLDSLSQPRSLITHFLYLHSHLSSKTSLDTRLKPGHPV